MMYFGVKRSKVKFKFTGSIRAVFHTNEYYAYVNAHLTDNSSRAWV